MCGRGEFSARDSEQDAAFGACGSNEGVWSSWWDLSFISSCSCFTVPCPGGIFCLCKAARILTIALDSLLRVFFVLKKKKKKSYLKHKVPLLLLEMFLQ